MEFSKLDDTRFPNIDTVSPYALKNTFDYTRWIPETEIHLVNVLWNGDYANVVKFDDDAARDSYFDSIEDSYTLTLKSNARIVPDGTVKLPLPYDVAARYNYLFVDIPLATSKDRMIQNETDSGVRRWYFFIADSTYSAPNTTVLTVQPDVWTNFIDAARLTYMMLERGHAPVSVTDVDSYLANPIANNRYLLAPDVNFDDSTVVRESRYVPVGYGEKYMLIATTMSGGQVEGAACGEVARGSSFSAPTYSDTSDWYGYQLQVNGYGFGNGSDYSGLASPVTMGTSSDGMVPNNLFVFAVKASDDTFLEDCRTKAPSFLRTVKAFFIASEDMLTLGEKTTFLGHDIWCAVTSRKQLYNYKATKDMFGFDENERRFAKLYTYPYSYIEVSSNDGRVSQVRIENTGNDIDAWLLVSAAFPVLDCRVLLSGVNGTGSQSYVWKNLAGTEIAKEVPNGDWGVYSYKLDIPTFALYMDGASAYMLDSYSSSMENARKRALRDYHNAVRSANLGYTNGVASAETYNSNSVRDADTAQTNSNSEAATAQTNANNYATASRDNTNATIAMVDANTTASNLASTRIMGNKNAAASYATTQSNAVSRATTITENENSIATTQATQEAQINVATASGAVSGAMYGAGGGVLTGVLGAVSLGLAGLYTSNITAHAANSNAAITAQATQDVTDVTTTVNGLITQNEIKTAIDNTNYEINLAREQTDNNITCLGTQRDNNYNTAVTNATNLYNMQTANASRTHDANVADANALQATSNANSSRTRDVGVTNAKETLETVQDTAESGYKDASRRAPVKLTETNGEGTGFAYGMNGVQFRLRTQSDSAIAQTAAQFARYGYALNQIWDVDSSGLKLMKHFTYWKAADIWVDVRDVASSEVSDELQSIFERGVTVWNSPDEIGKVSVYDN